MGRDSKKVSESSCDKNCFIASHWKIFKNRIYIVLFFKIIVFLINFDSGIISKNDKSGIALKYTILSAFEKHLESAAPNHLSDIYLIMGKEAFVRKQAVDRLIALVLRGEPSPELCIFQFDAERQPVESVLQELEMLAFFVKKRLVVVRNADAYNKDATLKLETYFASPNRTVCLVLEAAAINRATTFYKNAEKVGVLLDIAEEKPWEREKSVAEWLRNESNRMEKVMAPSTAQQLVKQLGTDQALLHSELQKLVCYVGDRTSIEAKDVSIMCGSVNHDNAWQLGEAIFNFESATALRISKALLLDGVALIALLRQIRSQFQTEYQVCSILTAGGSASDVGQEFPYMKGAILERHVRQSQSYGMARFRKGLLAIDATELQAKNSGTDPDFLAELLIVKLTMK